MGDLEAGGEEAQHAPTRVRASLPNAITVPVRAIVRDERGTGVLVAAFVENHRSDNFWVVFWVVGWREGRATAADFREAIATPPPAQKKSFLKWMIEASGIFGFLLLLLSTLSRLTRVWALLFRTSGNTHER